VGPDLKNISKKRPQSYLLRMIQDPGSLISQGNPTVKKLLEEYGVKMPNLGLSESQARAVLAYIEQQSGQAPAGFSAAVQEIAGDPVPGGELFRGELSFQNGGPPCLACHTASGAALLGGGTLGKDLTGAFTLFHADLIGIMDHAPFPSMRAVYENHPLTKEEEQNVAAFLKSIAGNTTVNSTPLVVGLAVGGLLILLVLILLVWQNRLFPVRRELIDRSRRKRSGT
jgi:mono/diheme cytochrome c family protein